MLILRIRSKRIEGQIKENEEKTDKKRSDVSLLSVILKVNPRLIGYLDDPIPKSDSATGCCRLRVCVSSSLPRDRQIKSPDYDIVWEIEEVDGVIPSL